jgi:hypothetical protein
MQTMPPLLADSSAWAFAGKVATILFTTFAGVTYFAGRAVSKAIWLSHLSGCEDNVKTLIDALYKEDNTVQAEARQLVAVHEDRLEFLDAALKEQGSAIRDSLAASFRAFTESADRRAVTSAETMQRIERALEAVHVETSENTAAIADVVGFMRGKGWTESDAGRRKTTRRKPA